MPDERGTLRGISWQEVCPWLCLFRVFLLAKQVPKLLLAAAGVLLTSGGWWLIGQVFAGSADVQLQAVRTHYYSRAPWTTPDESLAASWVPSTIEWGNRFSAGAVLDARQIQWLAQDPFLGSWQRLSRPFWQMFDGGFTFVGFTYVLLCALWAAAVWALIGGAITRMAAVELTTEQRLSTRQALRHAIKRWRSYFGAPFFPLLGVLMTVVGMSAVGWLLLFKPTLMIMAIGWPIFLAAGLLMAVLALGLVFGWPLMWATISSEGTDAFDALSRSYSYTYQRPLHYLFYAAVAAILGVLSWILVAAIASVVAYLSFWGLSWTAGGERIAQITAALPADVKTFEWSRLPSDVVATAIVTREPGSTAPAIVIPTTVTVATEADDLGTVGRYGVAVIGFWLGLVKVVAIGFAYSYFWTASTAIYLLLRRTADHTEMDEVYLEEEDATYRIPPLTFDPNEPTSADHPSPPLPTANGDSPAAESNPASSS